MDLADLSDDELHLLSRQSAGLKASMKALKAITNRVNERTAKQQQTQRKLERELDVLDALDSMDDDDDDDDEDLDKRRQELEAMQAKVEEQLGMGDKEAGGPEPETWLQALQPVQALPLLQLQGFPGLTEALQQEQQLLGNTMTDGSSDGLSSNSTDSAPELAATLTRLLADAGGPLAATACPSEAAGRATFTAVCYGTNSLALAAYSRFMAWCGEPEVVSGSQLSTVSQLYQWAGGAFTRPPNSSLPPGTALADSTPPVTIQWLPSAADVLDALTAMGLKQQQQQHQQPQLPKKGQRKQQPQQPQQPQQQQQQQHEEQEDGTAFRHDNMPLLLRLLGRVCRAHAAGRLDASALVSNQGQLVQLLVGLLTLMLDQRALVSCRCVLPEAFAALLEVPPEKTWDRLARDTGAGSLLQALSGGLGPSYRSAAHLLAQMPRSDRGTLLRQLGALQLLSKIIPKAKKQAPPSRISGMDKDELRTSLHQEVRRLLGPQDKIRALLLSISEPAAPGGKLQVSVLTSILEAADLVLWVDVSTPGVGMDRTLHSWFLDWLTELDRLLAKKLTHHRATAKVAAMSNAYRFAAFGCVVAN